MLVAIPSNVLFARTYCGGSYRFSCIYSNLISKNAIMTDDKASTPKAKAIDDMPKLKILALHGYRQNGDSFNAKIGAFRKTIRHFATVTCLTAPHIVENEDGAAKEEADKDPRAWWFNAEDCTFKATRVSGPAVGFNDTLNFIEKTFKDHGPFDGLMGFSQGGSLVAILAAMQQNGLLSYSFKFVIISSGFCSGSLVHKGFYDSEIVIPSLHIFGESDEIIPKEMSDTLAALFPNPTIQEHKGGHYVACSGSAKTVYKEFLIKVMKDELENSNQELSTL